MRRVSFISLILLVGAAAAPQRVLAQGGPPPPAQTPAPPAASSPAAADDASRSLFDLADRELFIGGRVTSIDGDPARFQRYQDVRDGLLFSGFRYLFEKPDGASTFHRSIAVEPQRAGHVDHRTVRRLRAQILVRHIHEQLEIAGDLKAANVPLRGRLDAQRRERVQLLSADCLSSSGEHVGRLALLLGEGARTEGKQQDGRNRARPPNETAHV